MKKGQIAIGKVLYSEFPNMGVVLADTVEGVPVNDTEQEEVLIRVKNTIPGQRVEVRLVKKRNGSWRGNLQNVIEKSKEETKPGEEDCDFYGLTVFSDKPYCGSCLYRTLPYEEELKIKSDQIKRLLSPVIPDFDYVFEGVTGTKKTDHYRNKMELSFGDDRPGGELLLGLHRRGSMYDIISCSGCKLMHPDMDKARRITESFFRESQIPYLHKRTHEGYLRHLLLRRSLSTGELIIGLVTTTQSPFSESSSDGYDRSEDKMLGAYTKAVLNEDYEGSIAGIIHIKNDRLGDVVVNEGLDILYGRDHITESVLGLEFKITPFSFFQTNTEGAGILYSKAREYIKDAL
ncbi:MAG: 23S rRNA (uracil-5-)-methyltransferase RumA, partial [Lachnospiraceae bacterium]|nr:23S rRNA (uracil-5-)-methyltransferase RumA [Lachnospiraceae bacterium]